MEQTKKDLCSWPFLALILAGHERHDCPVWQTGLWLDFLFCP